MIALITVQNVLPGVDFLSAIVMSAGYNPVSRFYTAFRVVILTIAGVYGINRSKLGLAMLCVREDEEAAAATGISVIKFKVIAMGLSTFIAGLAGGLFAYYYVSYYYYVPFDLVWSFDPVLIVFIGGAGTIPDHHRCCRLRHLEGDLCHQPGPDQCAHLWRRIYRYRALSAWRSRGDGDKRKTSF